MIENKTIIKNPKNISINDDDDNKEFTFDHSYWSFCNNDDNFASQDLVFEHLGKDIVGDALEGYNSCIFAYGQTGSGKTYTMMGDSNLEGLIPQICQWLFQQMSLKNNNNEISNKTGFFYSLKNDYFINILFFIVEISYLEIYNEQVRDLLDCTQDINGNFRRPLKVREHPKSGPYVEKLSKHTVFSYEDIYKLMQKGNTNRTTASTNVS